MRYVIHGRSRFTQAELELQIEAPSDQDARRKARSLGLEAVEAKLIKNNDKADEFGELREGPDDYHNRHGREN